MSGNDSTVSSSGQSLTGCARSNMQLISNFEEVDAASPGNNVLRLDKEGVEKIYIEDWECPGRTLEGHTKYPRGITVDGDRIVTAAHKTIKIWNIRTGECIKTLEVCHPKFGHSDSVVSVAVYKEDFIVSGSHDKTIKIWNISTGECIKTLEGHKDWVYSVAVYKDFIVSGSVGSIKIWNISTGECMKTLEVYAYLHCLCCFAVDGDRIVMAEKQTIRIWNIHTGECIKTVEFLYDVRSVAIDGDRMVIGGEGFVEVWDKNMRYTVKFEGSDKRFITVAVHKNYFVTGDTDNCVRVWSKYGQLIKTLSGHSGWVSFVAVNKDFIVSESVDSIKIWSLPKADAAEEDGEVEDVTDACLAEQERENKRSAIDLTEALSSEPPAKRQRTEHTNMSHIVNLVVEKAKMHGVNIEKMDLKTLGCKPLHEWYKTHYKRKYTNVGSHLSEVKLKILHEVLKDNIDIDDKLSFRALQNIIIKKQVHSLGALIANSWGEYRDCVGRTVKYFGHGRRHMYGEPKLGTIVKVTKGTVVIRLASGQRKVCRSSNSFGLVSET